MGGGQGIGGRYVRQAVSHLGQITHHPLLLKVQAPGATWGIMRGWGNVPADTCAQSNLGYKPRDWGPDRSHGGKTVQCHDSSPSTFADSARFASTCTKNNRQKNNNHEAVKLLIV